MFLATTALSEFWDKNQELLFLGQWCRLHGRRREWEGLRGRMLASPWEAPGALDRGAENISTLHEALLDFLTGFLNDAHGVRHESRYWRIILGPWLLGYTSAIVDHGLHLDRAFAAEPRLETWTLDPRDRRTPLDTADFATKVSSDSFQLQLYSEILESRGISSRSLRGPAAETPSPVPARWKTAVRAALSRAARAVIGSERIFSDFYASPRQTLSLMRAATLAPLGNSVASPRAPVDSARRARLAEFRASVPFAAEAAALLPRHLPILFLEGHADFRRAVLARWPRLPRMLLTSVGWYSNETFKLLAAEATERGAELIVSQHGGAYGMMDPIFSERHERRVSDRYFTWGWSDRHYPGGKTVPLPNPKMLYEPTRAQRPTGNWLLISTTIYRYPYSCYFANAPAAHRFAEQLEDRSRFVRSLSEETRSGLRVRLHPADLGWGHRERLAEEFPALVFDENPKPWSSRVDQFDLIAVDHPQTSITECLARDTPSLFFWNPSLWRMRPEAAPVLDGLRRARILIDSPEDAAREIPGILADPLSWWMRPEARAARAAFCELYARSSPEWLADWKNALAEAEIRP
jgi:putative transferase (TIGR04331 family)